jgi:hypothetical protein
MTKFIARLIIDNPKDIETIVVILQNAGYTIEVSDFKATSKDTIHKSITILKEDK